MPGVEIVAVANRSLESSRRAAEEFDIPRAYADWEQLIAADGIDAVLIGTWPYMHKDITLAALESGRHVLCQARMANNAAEAREMLAASQRHPDRVCMLVPSSSGYSIDRAMLSLRNGDLLGEILSVDVHRLQRGFANFDGELDWRHNEEFSGYQRAERRRDLRADDALARPGQPRDGQDARPDPDAAQRARRTRRGDDTGPRRGALRARERRPVHMVFSETTGLSRGNDTWIFGSEGTIHLDDAQNIFVGRRGDRELAAYPNPPEGQFRHRVEEEFVNAIRGLEPVAHEYLRDRCALHGVDGGRSIAVRNKGPPWICPWWAEPVCIE